MLGCFGGPEDDMLSHVAEDVADIGVEVDGVGLDLLLVSGILQVNGLDDLHGVDVVGVGDDADDEAVDLAGARHGRRREGHGIAVDGVPDLEGGRHGIGTVVIDCIHAIAVSCADSALAQAQVVAIERGRLPAGPGHLRLRGRGALRGESEGPAHLVTRLAEVLLTEVLHRDSLAQGTEGGACPSAVALIHTQAAYIEVVLGVRFQVLVVDDVAVGRYLLVVEEVLILLGVNGMVRHRHAVGRCMGVGKADRRAVRLGRKHIQSPHILTCGQVAYLQVVYEGSGSILAFSDQQHMHLSGQRDDELIRVPSFFVHCRDSRAISHSHARDEGQFDCGVIQRAVQRSIDMDSLRPIGGARIRAVMPINRQLERILVLQLHVHCRQRQHRAVASLHVRQLQFLRTVTAPCVRRYVEHRTASAFKMLILPAIGREVARRIGVEVLRPGVIDGHLERAALGGEGGACPFAYLAAVAQPADIDIVGRPGRQFIDVKRGSRQLVCREDYRVRRCGGRVGEGRNSHNRLIDRSIALVEGDGSVGRCCNSAQLADVAASGSQQHLVVVRIGRGAILAVALNDDIGAVRHGYREGIGVPPLLSHTRYGGTALGYGTGHHADKDGIHAVFLLGRAQVDMQSLKGIRRIACCTIDIQLEDVFLCRVKIHPGQCQVRDGTIRHIRETQHMAGIITLIRRHVESVCARSVNMGIATAHRLIRL